jgi:AraC family transcriptional regulator
MAEASEGKATSMLEQISHCLEREMVPLPSLQSLFGMSDIDRGEAHDEDVAPPPPAQAKLPASIVIKLLDRATETMDSDRAAARDCIARASALLRAENDRGRLARGGLAPWQVRLVTRHIDATSASTVRTQDCAKIARLSASHFSRAFKVSFGETFSHYVIRRRVERAQEMMMLTDEPLCQIALSCGFCDQSHFTRVYQRQVGSSPASWRRQLQVRAGTAIKHRQLSIGSDQQWPQRD